MHRKPDHKINPLILNRWSPRAMTGESIGNDVLMSLFEAARWAPSAYNNQPWRFIYAKRDTPQFKTLMGLLVEFNQAWCANAAVLGISLAKKTFEHNGKPSVTHAYDTGAAWENLALEGYSQGLVVHGMEGFSYEKARTELGIPEDYAILAMFAIGVPGVITDLPDTFDLRQKEKTNPTGRKIIEDFIMEGKFKA